VLRDSLANVTDDVAVVTADVSQPIRVNAVAPGTINTERVKRLPEEPGGPEYLEVIKAAHPMGRLGEPSEVAEAILFLASDRASFITGAILAVDGGFLAR
jgi:NAD(P)-dependent dehydrogenase (short-subunit alcohol dehydrogenase family)